MQPKVQTLLRVKSNSELGKLIDALRETEDGLTKEQIVETGGLARSVYTLKWAEQWFDNVSFTESGGLTTMRLFDVKSVAVPVASANGNGTDPSHQAPAPNHDHEPVEELRWPDTPPVLEQHDWFKKPGWYDTMAAMVDLGRAISLEGPPGVGKDTAVEELAAERGVPLVAVAGDGGLRSRQLIGSPEIVNGSTTFAVAEFAAAVVNGWWALITEVNAADPDVLLLLNSLMAAPNIVNIKGAAYHVHPDFRLFISYNAGLIGTKPLPQSTKDRFFSIKVPWFGKTQLKSRLTAHGMPAEAEYAEALLRFGMRAWTLHENGQLRWIISIRRLIDAVAMLEHSIVENVEDAITSAVINSIDSPVEAGTVAKIILDVKTELEDEERRAAWQSPNSA